MGVEEFSQTVRGSGGVLATAATGTVETDNYATGGSFTTNGAAWPVEVNPAAVMQEVVITQVGTDCELVLTTTGGDDVVLPLAAGQTLTCDKWETDSLTLRNPADASAVVAGGWAGE